jgi:hypothetical protein
MSDHVRNVLQKINRSRTADAELRKVASAPHLYAPTYRHSTEREGRHADLALTNALGELKDHLQTLQLDETPVSTWPVQQPAAERLQS